MRVIAPSMGELGKGGFQHALGRITGRDADSDGSHTWAAK